MSARTADVVIVGGGIIGCATAFFLRKRGLSVILLERDTVGQHASGVNFGNVRRQGRFLPQLPLAMRSREIWGRLPELIGEDVEFLPTGHLRFVYDRADADRLEAYARDCRPYGLELEIISSNALRERFPFLSSEVVLGSFSPHCGHANPRLAAPAFARAARRAGAEIIEGADVLSVVKSDEDFVIETRESAGLPFETQACRRVGSKGLRENLQRHRAPQAHVLRFVDDALTAATQLALQEVGPDPRARWCRRRPI